MPGVKAFDGVMDAPLSGRSAKPRNAGQTMVIDKGMGLAQTADFLELAADFIDYIKLSFGSAALYPTELLRTKIDLIRSYGIDVFPGGTFLEIALMQGALTGYLDRAKELGFTHIEVSDGSIDLSPGRRRQAILAARGLEFQVITEVGKKDGRELDPAEAQDLILADVEAGAVKVIVEGRESGKGAGIYDAYGEARVEDLEAITDGLKDLSLIMWEAPLKGQQEALIAWFGPNVNLGNIPPAEAFALEALRVGLRSDTFRLTLERASTKGRR